MIAKSLFDLKVEKWQAQGCPVVKVSPLQKLGENLGGFIVDAINYGNKVNKDYKSFTFVVKQLGKINRVYLNEQTNIFISVTDKELKTLNVFLKTYFKTCLKVRKNF